MAKGNMLLGYSRGSVGDVTFYRSGGSQRQRARNRQPNNPRTARQMAQRSVFANAVKFFKQVNSGFFRFAYEDKKTNESDYNAFMRHNVENSGYIGAKASKIADFPALGLWQLSVGSLREIPAPFPQPQDDTIYFDLGVTLTNNVRTVGDLSTQLISGDTNTWRVGDIITLVVYRATNANNLPTIYIDLGTTAYCSYVQLILNTNDTTALVDITNNVGGVKYVLQADSYGLRATADDETFAPAYSSDIFGFSVIHSRNTANGLKVSSSMMVFNKTEKVLSAMSDSGEYYNEILADWQASADAILQGAVAQSANNLPFVNTQALFLNNLGSVAMEVDAANVVNYSTINFDNGGGSSVNTLVVQFGAQYNPGYDVASIDHNHIRVDGITATYNASASEYTSVITQIAFNITAMTSAPATPIQVYYDDRLIMSITIR